MNKSFLTIGLSLALITTVLNSSPIISNEAAASNTAESTYTASFTVKQPEKVVVPGGETSGNLPEVNDWGFNSHLFIVSRIPCFLVDEVELEPDVVAGEYIPVLTFDPNPGWEVVEEKLEDGLLTTFWFYNTPVNDGAHYTPLFDSWTLTNFKVHSGICGSHTYAEIIDAVNSSGLERFSLQSDGISGSPQDLWSMARPAK